MGRTGNLLPYDEFVKVRPDVSKEEYGRYKAFKFDKEDRLNPFDDGNDFLWVLLNTQVKAFMDQKFSSLDAAYQ